MTRRPYVDPVGQSNPGGTDALVGVPVVGSGTPRPGVPLAVRVGEKERVGEKVRAPPVPTAPDPIGTVCRPPVQPDLTGRADE